MKAGFWSLYYQQGRALWAGAEAKDILEVIPGRQARRALYALTQMSPSDMDYLPLALTERLEAIAVGRPEHIGEPEKAARMKFDNLRNNWVPEEAALAREPPLPSLRATIKATFRRAATEVFGVPQSKTASSTDFVSRLEHGETLKTVLDFGGRPLRAVYWQTLSTELKVYDYLNVLCCLGLAGGTEWDLIGSEKQLDLAAKNAVALWRSDLLRTSELLAGMNGAT